jgi:hypothetical protein
MSLIYGWPARAAAEQLIETVVPTPQTDNVRAFTQLKRCYVSARLRVVHERAETFMATCAASAPAQPQPGSV